MSKLHALQQPSVVKEDATSVEARFCEYVSSRTGVQLDSRQNPMVSGRLRKRCLELKLQSVGDYWSYLVQNEEEEGPVVISLLTTHYTQFFRERSQFEVLEKEVLPALFRNLRSRGENRLRVWSAACSTGQETYSLAMTILKVQSEERWDGQVEILGTDIDRKCIEVARNGVYRFCELDPVPAAYKVGLWGRGSKEIQDFVRAGDRLRSVCRFAVHNLLNSAARPIDEVHILFCRNLFIYLKQSESVVVAQALVDALSDLGTLFIGASESLKGMGIKLVSLGPSIYRKPSSSVPSIESKEPQVGFGVKPRRPRVFMVDDSPTVLRLLREILEKESQFEVVGSTTDPLKVEDLVRALKPDVITLDVHLPGRSGLQVLQSVSSQLRIPTVMISDIHQDETDIVLECLSQGAIDFITKPKWNGLELESKWICHTVESAARAHCNFHRSNVVDTYFSDVELDPDRVIVIGASTGGPEAIRALLKQFPKKSPPIVVAQHIPEMFSLGFAKRLDEETHFEVQEAVSGLELKPGRVIIAPGGKQLRIQGSLVDEKIGHRVEVSPRGDSIYAPCVDILFQSAAEVCGSKSVAILLTGMGKDGAKGMAEVKKRGGFTLAQDEETSVVFGMPKEAIALGAVEVVADLEGIVRALIRKTKAR